jgi:hypothetical protein
MEKVAYLLTPRAEQSNEACFSLLQNILVPQLKTGGAHRASLCVHDRAVQSANWRVISNCQPTIRAVLFVWLDSANEHRLIEKLIESHADIVAGYLLTESEPLPPIDLPADGERVNGLMQLAFLKIPDNLSGPEWLRIWREDHTQIAVKNQSTFVYRQNLVVHSLRDHDPGFAAIVEECFPNEAMESDLIFYGASDDVDLHTRQKNIWNSSKRFIKLDDLDVLPTSEYIWR